MQKRQYWLMGGAVALLVVCACAAAACLTAGGFAAFGIARRESHPAPEPAITRQAPTRAATGAQTPSTTPGLAPTAAPQGTAVSLNEAGQTLLTLEEEEVPISDPRDLARRFDGKQNIPETLAAPQLYQVGQEQTFWAGNTQTNENFQVRATLEYATPHLYFWVENGVNFDRRALANLAETFETKIYPTNRDFFGSEWSPGIDDDVHLYVLYAGGLGGSVAGYFSSSDAVPPQVHPYSNGHEMFMINADLVRLDREDIYGTMAHEFQHMIHWYRDRNEDSWVNEGFSMLAELLNGYDTGGFDDLYAQNPDVQLTDWSESPASWPHYGASFLFMTYFLDRFGSEATQALVAHPENGMQGVDQVLAGQGLRADDAFADWTVANLLDDEDLADGRFAYRTYTPPEPALVDVLRDCPPDWQPRTVQQYGVDYIMLECQDSYTLEFDGAEETPLVPVDAYSGRYMFWSNRGDESDMMLTRAFDFIHASGPLTFRYQTWFDIEEDYDYAYLSISEDGQNWQILQPSHGRSKEEDPTGNAYGWAYNGQSGGWVEESVDLSAYAGKRVQLRFDYVTDGAVSKEGLLLDDIRIPELGYTEDFEQGEGGWQGDGFVRVQNRLPQTFVVTLVQDGRETVVQRVTLDENGAARIPLTFNTQVRRAVLVVSGTSRFTTRPASYQFRLVK